MSQKPTRRTVYGKPPQERMTARYILPSGIVEEVFLEAQRRRINPSQVLEEAVREGLPRAAASAVTERLRTIETSETDSEEGAS